LPRRGKYGSDALQKAASFSLHPAAGLCLPSVRLSIQAPPFLHFRHPFQTFPDPARQLREPEKRKYAQLATLKRQRSSFFSASLVL